MAAKKKSKAEQYIDELDQLILLAKDDERDWDETYARYNDWHTRFYKSPVRKSVESASSFWRKLDELDLALASNISVNAAVLINNSSTNWYIKRGENSGSYRNLHQRQREWNDLYIVLSALSKHPLLPIWIDSCDERMSKAIQEAMFRTVWGCIVVAYGLHPEDRSKIIFEVSDFAHAHGVELNMYMYAGSIPNYFQVEKVFKGILANGGAFEVASLVESLNRYMRSKGKETFPNLLSSLVVDAG